MLSFLLRSARACALAPLCLAALLLPAHPDNPLTLQQAVERALERSPDLAAFEYELQAQQGVLQQSRARPSRHHLEEQRRHARNCILLAEGNPVNQKVAQRLLERLHYRVDVVASGRAAVDAWRSGRYDLILMDCQMPELDGYAVIREIRRLENGEQHIPIVALTAHAMKGDDEKCTAAGMDGYLSKPLDRALLESTLRGFLSEALRRANVGRHAE